MGLAEILGILNLIGLVVVAILLGVLLRRRDNGPVQESAVTPEDLLRSQDKLTACIRQEVDGATQLLRREMGASRQETVNTVETSVSRLGGTLRQTQLDMAAAQKQQLEALTSTLDKQIETLTGTLDKQIRTLSETVTRQMAELTVAQEKQMSALADGQSARMDGVAQQTAQMEKSSLAAQEQMRRTLEDRLRTLQEQNRETLEIMRRTMEEQLSALRTQNGEQLEKMRVTVDEKLQKTLDERISQSFKLVNDRLSEVYRGLGEMKSLASSVGDLRKVLSGVKTRGILGEVQLGAIIEDMLTPEQYERNVVTRKGSRDPVEFAIRLPGDGEHPVLLPVDAKFPGDTYEHLANAYETGDPEGIREAQKALTATIRSEAKDIRDKYIAPPDTTDFGILFLPVEGLYAEALRLGLSEPLRQDYHVILAGPTTFAALLNSLQMGFRTLAIQKRSGEVWKVLGAVKTEFASFQSVLEAAQKRIEQTHDELDKLVGVRTRKINSKLRTVAEASAEEVKALLPSDAPGSAEDE